MVRQRSVSCLYDIKRPGDPSPVRKSKSVTMKKEAGTKGKDNDSKSKVKDKVKDKGKDKSKDKGKEKEKEKKTRKKRSEEFVGESTEEEESPEEPKVLTEEEWRALFRIPDKDIIEEEVASSCVQHTYHDVAHENSKRKFLRRKDPNLEFEYEGCVPLATTKSIPTPTYTECIKFSPDGDLLACCCYDEVIIYCMADKQKKKAPVEATLQHDSNVWRCCFHPTSPVLFSVCGKGKLYLWDMTTWKLERCFQVSNKCLFGLTVHAHTKFIAATGLDHNVHVFDMNNIARKLATLKAHEDSVEHIAFSPDGYTLASVSKDRSVRLWDSQAIRYHTRDKVESILLGKHGHWVMCAAFLKNGKKLVTASADGILKVWSLKNNMIEKTWLGHTNMVWSISTITLSNDMEVLLSVSSDGCLRLWHLDYATEMSCVRRLGGRSHGDGQLLCLSVHHDNTHVAVGTFHERAYVLEVPKVEFLPWHAIAHVAEKVTWAPEPSLATVHSYPDENSWEDEDENLAGKKDTKEKDPALMAPSEQTSNAMPKRLTRTDSGDKYRKVVFKAKYRSWLEYKKRVATGEARADEHRLSVDEPPELGKFIVPEINIWINVFDDHGSDKEETETEYETETETETETDATETGEEQCREKEPDGEDTRVVEDEKKIDDCDYIN